MLGAALVTRRCSSHNSMGDTGTPAASTTVQECLCPDAQSLDGPGRHPARLVERLFPLKGATYACDGTRCSRGNPTRIGPGGSSSYAQSSIYRRTPSRFDSSSVAQGRMRQG